MLAICAATLTTGGCDTAQWRLPPPVALQAQGQRSQRAAARADASALGTAAKAQLAAIARGCTPGPDAIATGHQLLQEGSVACAPAHPPPAAARPSSPLPRAGWR